MNPTRILSARKMIRKLDKKECEKIVEEILKMNTSEEIKEKLTEYVKKIN